MVWLNCEIFLKNSYFVNEIENCFYTSKYRL